MRHVRASSGRPAAAVAADVTAVADTVGVGDVTVVASEEAATSQPALPAGRCCRVRCLSRFALAADLISALRTRARYSCTGKIWAGLDSNQRRRKASRFTVCPVWPLRYLPFWREGFHISSRLTACNSRQLSPLLIALLQPLLCEMALLRGLFWFGLFLVLTFCFV